MPTRALALGAGVVKLSARHMLVRTRPGGGRGTPYSSTSVLSPPTKLDTAQDNLNMVQNNVLNMSYAPVMASLKMF